MFAANSTFINDIKTVLSSINDPTWRQLMKNSVVLGGGNSITPGFKESLEMEISVRDNRKDVNELGEEADSFLKRLPAEVREILKTYSTQEVSLLSDPFKTPQDRRSDVWLGGSILTNWSGLHRSYLLSQDYSSLSTVRHSDSNKGLYGRFPRLFRLVPTFNFK